MGSGKGQQKRVNAIAPNTIPLDKIIQENINNTFINVTYSDESKKGRVNINSKHVSFNGIMRKNGITDWDINEMTINFPRPGKKKDFLHFDNIKQLFQAAEKWSIGELYPELYLSDKESFVFWRPDNDQNNHVNLWIGSDAQESTDECKYVGDLHIGDFQEMSKSLLKLKELISNIGASIKPQTKPINHNINF